MPVGHAQPLPFPVRQALIQACGKVFYYKNALLELFASAGVPAATVQRYIDEGHVKFQIARCVLEDLDRRGATGRRVQDQIVEAMLGLDGPADDIADPKQAKEALEKLRRVVGKRAPVGDDEAQQAAVAARRHRVELQRRAAERQAKKIQELRQRFAEITSISDKQERGYAFEPFLRDLFHACDLDYRPSYRVGVEQIDGAFRHAGRDFLVEARWRDLPPSANDLLAFAAKVAGKLQGTLGLVITMVPPRPEVLDHVATRTRSVIVMDGRDLALVLEGQVPLPEALEYKRQRAAQEGLLFASLAQARAA
jgi:hypothetical protein